METTPALASRDAALSTARPASHGVDARRTREVAMGFESIFVHQLLAPLDELEGSFFGGGAGGRIFGGLFRQHVADAVAAARPLGIGALVERSLTASGAGEGDPERAEDAAREIGTRQGRWNALLARESYGRIAR